MASDPAPVVIDFETFQIQGRPHYPPLPVGVSIQWPGKKPRYYAWAHVTANNASFGEAVAAVAAAYAHPEGVVFQNGKFDLDVAETHLGLEPPPWDRVHDTMFLLFLDDPHQPRLDLKSAAERLLGMVPEERDAMADWLVEHQPVPGTRISASLKSAKTAMAYLPFAPGSLVGQYANGDTERTGALFAHLYPRVRDRLMIPAYNRERMLLPILLTMERQGLPVDLPRLAEGVETYHEVLTRLDAWLVKRLKVVDPAFNPDSGEQLMKAAITAGIVDEDKLPLTATGKLQSNKEALALAITDPVVVAVLKYRAQLSTCLHTFMEPWLQTAQASGGLIYTTWHQTRSPAQGGLVGTRTGRLSSTPNFQNIPNQFEPIFQHEAEDPALRRKLPKAPFALPPLPAIRSYVIPFKGEVLLDRDYSQQELRILAHFDDGALQAKYQANPWLDMHDDTQAELAKVGKIYQRKAVKNTNFGLIYGMGVGKMAEKNGMPVDEAKGLKTAVLKLYPGLKELYATMKQRAKANQPIRTWGGREYYCEPAKLINGRLQEYDYKLVNVLIQGSAADCTKEAIIQFWQRRRPTWKLILNVHDQLTVSVPIKDREAAMLALKTAMESIPFDVPMLTEGKTSAKSWGDLQPYDKRGLRV